MEETKQNRKQNYVRYSSNALQLALKSTYRRLNGLSVIDKCVALKHCIRTNDRPHTHNKNLDLNQRKGNLEGVGIKVLRTFMFWVSGNLYL